MPEDVPCIAVVLETYNGASSVRTQLLRFFQQVHVPTALLVGDDCSSDSTRSVLEATLRTPPSRHESSIDASGWGTPTTF